MGSYTNLLPGDRAPQWRPFTRETDPDLYGAAGELGYLPPWPTDVRGFRFASGDPIQVGRDNPPRTPAPAVPNSQENEPMASLDRSVTLTIDVDTTALDAALERVAELRAELERTAELSRLIADAYRRYTDHYAVPSRYGPL